MDQHLSSHQRVSECQRTGTDALQWTSGTIQETRQSNAKQNVLFFFNDQMQSKTIQSVAHPIDGGIVSLLLSPIRMHENLVNI